MMQEEKSPLDTVNHIYFFVIKYMKRGKKIHYPKEREILTPLSSTKFFQTSLWLPSAWEVLKKTYLRKKQFSRELVF